MLRQLRILRFLLIIWVLGCHAYGIEVELRGLNIEQILAPSATKSNVEVPENTTHFDVMLQHYPFSASIIDEQVVVTMPESPAQLSDTDQSIEEEKQEMLGSLPIKFASKFNVDQSQIPLKASEIDHSQPPDQIIRDLCFKLSQDAFRIANAHKSARTREATTRLCIILRDEEQCAKKLVFHNSTGEMQSSMRQKANDLGYGIRNAHLAHAEVQLIDFLVHRAQQRANEMEKTGQAVKPRYTHILGMGCSRKHCQECNALCKLFLGKNYSQFTAATSKLKGHESIPVVEALAQEDEADLKMTIPAAVQRFKVVTKEEAIRNGNNKSTNYRLTEKVQKCIQGKCGLTLDFTNPRFNSLGHAVTQPSIAAVPLPAEDDDMYAIGEQKTENSKELKPPPEKKKKANP